MRRSAILLALALVACSASTPTVDESSLPTPSTQGSIPPRKPAPVAREAVFAADDAIYLYDVAKDKIRELAKGTGVREPRWVSKTQVSFVQGEPGAPQGLRLVDITKRTVTDLFTVRTGIDTYGWSPDRETVAYITTDRYGYPHLEYRSVNAGVTQSVATLAQALGREGGIADQRRIAFDRSGQYVMVVDTFADGTNEKAIPEDQSQFQVRTVGGQIAFAVDQYREPTMGEWGRGGRVLYYRTDTGVRSWKVGTNTSRSVSSVRWFDPSSSPDGSFIAYDTGAVNMKVSVELLVLKDAHRTSITSGGFYHPVAASSRTVWVQRVTPCKPDCPTPVAPSPEVFAVDIKTKKTKKLALTTLSDLDVRYA